MPLARERPRRVPAARSPPRRVSLTVFGKAHGAYLLPAMTIAVMNKHTPPNADAGTSATNSDDDLLDADPVAQQEFHGLIRPGTIRAWRTARRAQPLAYVVAGRKRLYRRGDVRKFIAEQTHQGAPK